MIVERRVRRHRPTLVKLDSGEWVEEADLGDRDVVFDPDPTVDWEADDESDLG